MTTTRRIKIARFSIGIFSVFSNDKNKNYDTIWSAWEFAKNREQPEVYGLISLEVMLFQNKVINRWVVKKVWKRFIQSPQGWTAMCKMTCIYWIVPKMERKVRQSHVCAISKKTNLFFMILLICFDFFTCIIIFSHIGPLGSLLGGLWEPWLSCWGLLGPPWVT